MSLRSVIRCRRVAVFTFIFLNCLLAAAPFTYSSSVENGHPIAADYSCQHQGQADSEENFHFKHSEQRCEYSHTSRKKNLHRFNNIFSDAAAPVTAAPSHTANAVVSSSFPSQPGYYGYLFLYQLF